MSEGATQPDRPGWRVLIVGTGGQGVVTAARLLCDALVEHGHNVVSGQLHGMAQRGGCVQSSLMIDCGISPVIPLGRADFVLGFEPVETARALPFMSRRTVVFMNTAPVVPFVLGQRSVLERVEVKYPDVEGLADAIRAVTPHVLAFDATQRASESGSAKTLNIIMLGCFLGSGALPCTPDEFWETACKTMPPALAENNTKAFFSGVDFGQGLHLAEANP